MLLDILKCLLIIFILFILPNLAHEYFYPEYYVCADGVVVRTEIFCAFKIDPTFPRHGGNLSSEGALQVAEKHIFNTSTFSHHDEGRFSYRYEGIKKEKQEVIDRGDYYDVQVRYFSPNCNYDYTTIEVRGYPNWEIYYDCLRKIKISGHYKISKLGEIIG